MMTEAGRINELSLAEIDPQVGEVATRLLEAAERNGGTLAGKNWALVEEILGYAAEASQKVAEQSQRIHYLESLSTTDELTGLANRRGLLQYLYRTLSRSRRHRESGVIGYLDIDDLKRVNDTYGHEAGDAAIGHMAGIIRNNIRASDFAARIGGDEFILVLERAQGRAGAERLEHIRGMIESSPVNYRGVSIVLRASLGVARFDAASGVNELLAIADDAMYRDKATRKQQKIAC